MTYRHPLAFRLGLEGIALLRAFAGDGDRFDRAFVEARLAEVRTLIANEAELGEPATIGRTSTVDGYRARSATYDEPGNALIAVEQPFVRAILETLPVDPALDAAAPPGARLPLTGARPRPMPPTPRPQPRSSGISNPTMEATAGE